jgi:hypothetical protein
VAVAAVVLASGVVISATIQSIQGGPPSWQSSLVLYLAYASFPVCIGVAVLRYRLFDLDVVINRAALLTIATAMVGLGYVAVVVAVGGNAGGFWPSLLATAVVALAFQPLRASVVRFADRVVYGKRAVPYEALANFSRRLGESPDPANLLPAIAEAAAGAVSADRATVQLAVDRDHRLSAAWPVGEPESPSDSSQSFAVANRGEELGDLQVQLRPGRTLRDHERRLLERLAEQAALAFRNIRLETELSLRVQELARNTAALDESRLRLIEAQDRERARIQRAIALEVMPHLEPLPVELADLGTRGDASVATPLEKELGQLTAALDRLRKITRGVHPTASLSESPGPARVVGR